MTRLVLFNRLFPLWAILMSVLAFLAPELLSSWQSMIVPLLAAVMFLMGVTLTEYDFKRIVIIPRTILICVLLTYLVMP